MTKAERKTIYDRIVFNIHPVSLLLSAGAVLAGLAASVVRGGVAVSPALLTLVFAVLIQISGNLYYGLHRVRTSIEDNMVEQRDIDRYGYKIMRPLSQAFFILAVTVAMPLFTYIRWWSILYLGVVVLLEYFFFCGPRPLVNTRWSALVTFLLFGPVAVSGTAFVQNASFSHITPVVLYSIVSGLLAANGNIALQFLRREDKVRDGMTTLLDIRGAMVVRIGYLFNVLAVCAIMVLCPEELGFASPWYAVVVGVFVIGSAVYVFRLMKQTSVEAAMKIRKYVIAQYVAIALLILFIALFSLDTYGLSIFSPHHH